jgi:ribosome-associated protein
MGDDDRVIDEHAETVSETAPGPVVTDAPAPRRGGLPDRPGRPRRGRDPLDPTKADAAATAQVDPEALALAHRIVDLAVDKKASDVVLIDIHLLTSIADYLVICSGGSERQLGGIAGGIIEVLKDEGVMPYGREGGPSAHWALIDYGSVVVHVMANPERDFYQLEKLWSDAPLLLHIQ